MAIQCLLAHLFYRLAPASRTLSMPEIVFNKVHSRTHRLLHVAVNIKYLEVIHAKLAIDIDTNAYAAIRCFGS